MDQGQSIAAYRVHPRSGSAAPNGKDLIELPEEVRENVKFHVVEHVDELLQTALIGYNAPKSLSNELPDNPIEASDAPAAEVNPTASGIHPW